MRNISVPTNDTMIYAVHGNTIDECIADCAKLMAYLTANSVPENAEDEEDEHPDDCYCSYTYEENETDDDDWEDEDEDYNTNSTKVYKFYYYDGYDESVPSDDTYSSKEGCIAAAVKKLMNIAVYKEFYDDYVECAIDEQESPLSFRKWIEQDIEEGGDLCHIEENDLL